jgi:rod shape-determining protein MreC
VLRFNKKNLVYFLVFIIPFTLLLVRSPLSNSFKFFLIQTSQLPIKFLSYPLFEIKKIIFYRRTFNEYTKLKKETETLRSRLAGHEELMQENMRLEKLLSFKRNLIYSSVVANVVGREPSRWNSSMIIDKGQAQGVKPGMAVVNSTGVVGKVLEVGRNSSKVILLTDPQFSVAAVMQNSRESVLVSGSLQGFCRLRFIDSNAGIRLGDRVITSKMSSAFPEGLLIGEVIEIKPTSEFPSVDCLVQPYVSLSQLEEVLVILK